VPACAAVLIAYAIARTVRPVTDIEGRTSGLISLLVEVGLNIAITCVSGYWESPFVFSLFAAVMMTGFARGFSFAIRTALVSALIVSGAQWATAAHADTDVLFRMSAQWSILLLLVALTAGYGRRLFGEVEERHSLALDRMSRLAEANTLLYSLHHVARALPASLDLGDALTSTVGRLRDLFDVEIVTIILHDDASGVWEIGACDGARLEGPLVPHLLPPPVVTAMAAADPLAIVDLDSRGGPGLVPGARSGLYAPLRARGSLVGLVALEHTEPGRFGHREESLLRGFVESAALAVDNARWFSRLRTLGADEERIRIARELHDRIGQSLAYVGFELERIARRAEHEPVHEELGRLREDVRSVLTEVRETLYDLRTEVTEQQDIARTLEGYLERVHDRSGMEVALEHEETSRLPLIQERELWRIAQEAITNGERHSGGSTLTVRWRCDATGAVLEVSDDGKGFAIDAPRRQDAYGLVGMRERADAIGATLELESVPGSGTTIRCRLEAT
jgi:signal transduction histidine kinase